jgi:peptidyl-prolyl cis-trans isomerase D
MFEFIRTHQKLMQIVLLLLILPSFVAIGIYGYDTSSANGNVVAKVAGQAITQQEVDTAHRQQMDRMRQMFGGQIDSKMFDTPEARQEILDSLITERVLRAEAKKNGLSISDESLAQAIIETPAFKDESGKFNKSRYNAVLQAQGMTPQAFDALLRQDLILQQMGAAIQATAFAPKTVAAKLSELNEQEREVQELVFKASDFASEVKITDDMLKDYYEKNGSQFEVPEQVKAEYVLLNNEAVAAQITVSDADIKSYYEENVKQRYSTEEQRQASHILIGVNRKASEEEKAKAKTKAEQILGQLRKNPTDFAKLARENSQDPGSAEKGGDLGFFRKGMMVKPFEDAAFNLKQGEISDLVQSDFGFHIIKVTAIKPAAQRSLDEVKGEITAEIKKQLAAKKYSELAESFTEQVESSDGLKQVADKLGLKVSSAENLTRKGNPGLPPNAPVNHPQFLQALFSDDVVKNKYNTQPIEVEKNTLISGRVVEHKPATRKPYEEVKAVIRERVSQTEAAALAKKKGEARLAELNAKPSAAGFAAPKVVSRAKNPGLNNQAFLAVMKADGSKLPSHVGVDLPMQGYAIYRINKVMQPAAIDTARRQSEQQQIANALAQQEAYSYIQALKQNAKIEILKPVAQRQEAEEGN